VVLGCAANAALLTAPSTPKRAQVYTTVAAPTFHSSFLQGLLKSCGLRHTPRFQGLQRPASVTRTLAMRAQEGATVWSQEVAGAETPRGYHQTTHHNTA